MSLSWQAFWNGDHAIYVNERHKLLHYQTIAQGLASHVPRDQAHVLDQGCGEALRADIIARRCAKLYLCDGASIVRDGLKNRFAHEGRIVILAPEGVSNEIADGSLDCVFAHSLIQYLSRDELMGLLGLWHRKLKPEGMLILGDVILLKTSAFDDALELLRFAWEGGFLGAAVMGLIRTALSDYRTLRKNLGLSCYSAEDTIALLHEQGFSGHQAVNIGHHQKRMLFKAQKLDIKHHAP